MSESTAITPAPPDLLSADPDTLLKIAAARRLGPDAPPAPQVVDVHIRALLDRQAALYERKRWLTFYEETEPSCSYSYAEFRDAVRRLANALVGELGVRRGDRVATLLVNDPDTALIYFACWYAGVTVVPINCGEEDDRIGFILKNCDASICFCLPEQAERVAALRSELPRLRTCVAAGSTIGTARADFAAMLEPAGSVDLPDFDARAEALIVYTSGTTGAPKGVALDQGNLMADARSIADWHRFGSADRAMNILPIHHVNGTIVTLMTPLVSGGSVVLNRRFRAHAFWKTLAEQQCTWVSVVPTVLAFLCELKDDPRALFDLCKLRHIVCGAGPLTCDLARRFYDRFGVRIVHGYGLSETTCYSSFLPIEQEERDYRRWMFDAGFPSIGCPISANEMAIHDERGQPVTEDARGEIVTRGVNVMKYYFQRPDANRDTFAHGWFRTGDEGFRRRGGDGRDYFFITGRLKELIIRGGVNISPFDVDEVLCQAPGVKAAMAVGFENDFYGEEVGAYVQRVDGAETDAEEILAFARERLPYAKAPKVVVFGETFPVTSTGKYQRNRLKPLFAEWKASEFREKR